MSVHRAQEIHAKKVINLIIGSVEDKDNIQGLTERLQRIPTIEDKIEIVKGHYYFTPIRGKSYIISEVNFNII